MKRLGISLAGFCLALLACSVAAAQSKSMQVVVESGPHSRTNTPVHVPLVLDEATAGANSVTLQDDKGNTIPGQLTKPSLHSDAKDPGSGKVARELHFILKNLPAGKQAKFTVNFSDKQPQAAQFVWMKEGDQYAQLNYGDRPVLRYMCQPLDPSKREETYKVFHHAFSPDGKQIVTKGPGGKYTHHRGLFFGFNKVSYDEGRKKCDIWHCRGAHQAHAEYLLEEAGPVLGRHRVLIHWNRGDETFAKEQREMTVYATEGGNLIEFASHLETQVGPIRLDGDPQHAGFHFRASNEVAAKTNSKTYYVRPDGKGKMRETRNWPGKKDHVNLPFNAMSFVLGEQRFTAAYLDRPDNPKEARFSERDYGRFGSYFEYDVTAQNPLNVKYRIWLQEGEMQVDEIAAKRANLVEPPAAKVK